MFRFQLKNLIGKGGTPYLLGQSEEADLELLLEETRKNLPSADEQLIIKAFHFCVATHKNKIRKSGEPYYTHPLSVARIIVNEMPLDDISVAAALLHDVVVEGEGMTIKEIRSEFGTVIAELVDGINKIKTIESYNIDKEAQFEIYQRLLLSLFKDVRIILVKLADRLHNMRTLDYLIPERQHQIANETMEVYSAFAHRFGLGNIKWELEDLGFKYLNRTAYEEIGKSLNSTRRERDEYVKKFSALIKERLSKDEFLKKNNVTFEFNGRAKHIFSIFNKMRNRGLSINELNDLFAVRIIIDSDEPNLCFFVYGIICEVYQPVPGTFKNYISTPKKNGYKSLHTAVVGLDNRHVEVQVRSRAMHEVSERGVAAHFRYKSGPLPAQNFLEDKNVQQWLDSVREIFENLGDETPQELMESVRTNIFQDEIYVFTPKKELRILPKNATPLDFAFNIHTEIGAHCIGAKVDGRVVPLNYKLKSGDQVEILISDKQEPEKEWLSIAVTSHAKSSILKYINNSERKLEAKGMKIWEEFAASKDFIVEDAEFTLILQSLKFKDKTEFYISIGHGATDPARIYEFIRLKVRDFAKTQISRNGADKQKQGKPESTNKQKKSPRGFASIIYSQCCKPIPGDKITGIITPANELFVHRKSCHSISEYSTLSPAGILDLSWDLIDNGSYKSDIRISGSDRSGLLNDVTNSIISFENTNIQGVSIDTAESNFEGLITVNIRSLEQLNLLCSDILQINGVRTVERI